MAEVKSTLDLVMEKTRHLTLSDEEKREQKEKEFKKNLKGPAQKFQDQTINKRELKKEIKDNLAQKRFISGSDVVSNIASDDEWIRKFQDIKDRFDKLLVVEKARITG